MNDRPARVTLETGNTAPAAVINSLLSHCPPVLSLVLFYIAYVLAGGFGQGLAIIPGVSITFWPPAGIFVAMLLLNNKPGWPWWIGAACLAELTCNAIWFHNPIPFALIYFAANALEALTAAWLIGRFVGKPFRLETLEEVAAFVVLGAIVAPVVGATMIAATDALLGKHAFLTAWPLVWLGDSTGLLVSTPLALVAVQSWQERMDVPLPRLIEALVLLVVLAIIGAFSFSGHLPTAFMTMPPLLWAAARFQLRGAAVALALIAATEALFTVSGRGAIAGDPDAVKENIILLQTFFGISAVSALVVAALSLLHQKALRNEQTAKAELELRVAERTADLQEHQAQLSQRLAELNALHAGAPIGLAYVDRELRFRRINQVLAETNGLPVEAHLGRTIREAVPALADTIEPIYRRVLDTGEAVRNIDITGEMPSQPGVVRSWQSSFEPVPGADGKPIGVNVAVVEITERKRAEEALQASEAFSRSVLEASPDCVKVIGPGGELEFMNAHGLRQMEIDDFSFCRGAQWSSLWPDQTKQTIADSVFAARNGMESRFEAFCPTAKGTPKWWDVAVSPVLDARQRCTRIVSISRDISERKQAEEALRRSEEQLRLALEAGEAGTWSWDAINNVSVWDDRYQRQYGFAPSEPPSFEAWLARVHPDDRDMLQARLQTILATPGDNAWQMEFRATHPQLGERWMLGLSQAERDQGGRVISMAGLNLDITERKRIEQDLRDRDDTLQLALRAAYSVAFTWDVKRDIVKRLFSSELGLPATGDGSDSLEGVMQAILPEDRDTFRANIEASFSHPEGLYRGEYRVMHDDGEIHWLSDWGKLERDANGRPARLAGIVMDITERKRHEQHQKLMMNELNHRVKNTLATIQSMAGQTLRNSADMAEAKERLEGRLMALSKAHDVLTREKWESAPLIDVVDRAIAPYRSTGPERFSIEGPALRVPPRFALAIAMALHELGTNAVKYGALSNDKGKVSFTWSITGGKARSKLKLRWVEKGGPKVAPPARKGFGSRLIERGLASDLNGEVKLTYAKTGVTCSITAPLERGKPE